MFSLHKVCIAVAIVVALPGCDAARNIGRSPEQRINEARPMRADTLQARNALQEAAAADPTGNIELTTRERVRALTCAKGYSPPFYHSKETVARNLPDQKCFDDYDRDTVQWLRGKKLHRLLTAGPLRTVPKDPVNIFATSGGVNTIKFAQHAPIAVSTSNDTVEVLDAGSGESIFLDRNLPQHPHSLAISPNGRVFSVGGSNGVNLRDAQTGEVLFDLPEHQRFTWLDGETGVAIKRNQAAVDLIDFANSGVAVPIRGIDVAPTRVVALPGDSREFVLSSHKSLLRYALKRSAEGVEAILQDQKAGPPGSWSDNSGEATTDGVWYVHASNDLWITNLATLTTQQISLSPFRGRAAGPLANPDEVLLFPAGGDLQPMVFSLSKRTFAPVEDDHVTAQPGYSALRAVFIPALKRLAIVTGSKVLVVDEVKRGPQYGPEALAQLLNEQRRIQQEKNARAIAASEGFTLDRVVDGVPVASSPLLAAAADARVDGVGVYESKSASQRADKRSAGGVVTITLQRSAKPIVLVLSSYESVTWRISGARSANLKAVLLSGYSPSFVTGAEGVEVVQIGGSYAYKRGGSGFFELQREVIKRIGKGIETFQGEYAGAAFVVGGR